MLLSHLIALLFFRAVGAVARGWHLGPSLDITPRSHATIRGKRAGDTLTELAVADNIRVRFKEPNICETTGDVRSFSGYVDLGEDLHAFFWFFEARREPETAPVTLWLNGGPGSDSLVGLFNGIGPCKINPDLTTTLNPQSWNEESNILFLSQPFGVGFSHETTGVPRDNLAEDLLPFMNSTSVDRSDVAAILSWHTTQAFLQKLPEMGLDLQSKEFHLWTESYGGHYGPAFYRYFYEQNELIRKGELEGLELELKTLGIGNGIIDAATQFPSYPAFAANNTYGIEVLDSKWIAYMTTACYMVNGCLDQLWRCRQSYTDSPESLETRALCSQAANMCRDNVEGPYYAYSGRNMYDIRKDRSERIYADFFVRYLNLPGTQEALGVDLEFSYEESSYDVYLAFQQSGDYAYPSFMDDLVFLLENEVRVVMYYGDADYIGNWFGGEAVSLALNHTESIFFRPTPYTALVTGGVEHGRVREYGNLGLAVVHEAGHLVAVDAPGVALDLFRRGVRGRDLASGEKDVADMVKIPLVPDLPGVPYAGGS